MCWYSNWWKGQWIYHSYKEMALFLINFANNVFIHTWKPMIFCCFCVYRACFLLLFLPIYIRGCHAFICPLFSMPFSLYNTKDIVNGKSVKFILNHPVHARSCTGVSFSLKTHHLARFDHPLIYQFSLVLGAFYAFDYTVWNVAFIVSTIRY